MKLSESCRYSQHTGMVQRCHHPALRQRCSRFGTSARRGLPAHALHFLDLCELQIGGSGDNIQEIVVRISREGQSMHPFPDANSLAGIVADGRQLREVRLTAFFPFDLLVRDPRALLGDRLTGIEASRERPARIL
jgi:hypothetical protein